MFEVGLFELAVIALVALLVLGPEKLPRAARTVGLYVRKARQSWYSVRADIERELAADELRRSLKRAEESVREASGLAEASIASIASPTPASPPPASEPPPAGDEPRAPRDEPPAA
jgi:sec-independent protein translocase protein TatB